MNLLSGEIEAASGKITEGATTLNQALEGVVLNLGAFAEETLELLGDQAAFKARHVTSAAILGVADGVRASFSGKTGNTIPAGSTIPDSVISGVNTILGTQGNNLGEAVEELGVNAINPLLERIVMRFGGDEGSTIPEAINLVKNSMKSKCYNIGKKALIVGAAVGTTIVAYYLFKKLTHPGSLNKCNLNKSNLLVQSSGFTNGVMSRVASLFRSNKSLKKLILNPHAALQAKEALKNFMIVLKNIRSRSNGLNFKSLLLNGPKGTGKTLFIDHLIKISNLDYVKINSFTFMNFEDGTESKAIAALFGLIKRPKKEVVFVVEEADILLNRPAYKAKLLDLLRWLKSNNAQFMLIVCAENKSHLDNEIFALIDNNIEFSLPEEQERNKFLTHSIDGILKEYDKNALAEIVSSLLNKEKIDEIAKQTVGFSYEKLALLCNDLKIAVLRNKDSFTKEITNKVLRNSLELKAALGL